MIATIWDRQPVQKCVRAGLCLLFSLLVAGCQLARADSGALPTFAATAGGLDQGGNGVPSTWTPPPNLTPPTPTPNLPRDTRLPTTTPLPIPTNTPVTPSPTPSKTPTPAPSVSATVDVRHLDDYDYDEVIPLEAFPRPVGDNGWGVHWIPTYQQEPAVVDRFVGELVRMHIRWVVILNDNAHIGDNDYLVERLVANGIMPVMRMYRSNVTPYDGDLGKAVAHYRAMGVYYFQLYNEPNVNEENTQSFANANQYAIAWAAAAREVIYNGGLPGLGALSPGGAYHHYTFLERTIQALRWNGDEWLLNRAWISVHNYNGLRSLDDEDGFFLFRKYDEIVRHLLGRSLPMIGTEGGSYSNNPQVEKELLIAQYSYMRDAEPYFFAFSHWVLANKSGGSWDTRWEFQALFREGFVHPVVTDFFYRYRR